MDPRPPHVPLHSKLAHLSQLFFTLPDHLPFRLDGQIFCSTEDDLGYAGALNTAFHHAWGYKADGLVISERGMKLDSTLAVINHALNYPGCDLGVVESWVDALTTAALHATTHERAATSSQDSASPPSPLSDHTSSDIIVLDSDSESGE